MAYTSQERVPREVGGGRGLKLRISCWDVGHGRSRVKSHHKREALLSRQCLQQVSPRVSFRFAKVLVCVCVPDRDPFKMNATACSGIAAAIVASPAEPVVVRTSSPFEVARWIWKTEKDKRVKGRRTYYSGWDLGLTTGTLTSIAQPVPMAVLTPFAFRSNEKPSIIGNLSTKLLPCHGYANSREPRQW